MAEFPQAKGLPGERLDQLRQFAVGKGIIVELADSMGTTQGASLSGRILLRRGMPPAEEFSTLAHEIAHEVLHRQPSKSAMSRTVRETEAEAVAYVVCQAVGLDCGTASSDYIQLYSGDKNTLLGSLQRIQATAAEIIEAVLDDERDQGRAGERVSQPPSLAAAA
jgi:hypothetical protein